MPLSADISKFHHLPISNPKVVAHGCWESGEAFQVFRSTWHTDHCGEASPQTQRSLYPHIACSADTDTGAVMGLTDVFPLELNKQWKKTPNIGTKTHKMTSDSMEIPSRECPQWDPPGQTPGDAALTAPRVPTGCHIPKGK